MNNYTLLTGAVGGLGQAFVFELLKQNKSLLLVSTKQEKLDNFIKKYKEIFQNKNIKTFVCDLSKKEQITNLINFIKQEKITVNTLINNAGVIIEGDLENFSDEQIENAIMVNCIGTLDLTKNIIKIRDKNQKLEVLTVASVASRYPIPHMGVYSATKAFLLSMMLSLSYEYSKKDISFSTVCPGGMATTQEMKDSIKSMGIGGKLSTLSTEKVAKIALKGLKRGKRVITPGFFNKFLVFLGKLVPITFQAKQAGNIYKKSQIKRGLYKK
ncbi:MAG: SDR family NAD(P)-dependent oxidoreductase [Clostridia bacterium]|nr:SDR family NAD(P)-dependent oxidoreductase [Clostridia bacterium]